MSKKYVSISAISLCIYLIIISTYGWAGWVGPTAVISETWGSANNHMGLTQEDTSDSFPEGFWILGDLIVVRDQENRRMKIYFANGQIDKIVNWTPLSDGSFKIPEYPLAGICVGYASGNLYTYYSPQSDYEAYSPTGQLIKTSTSMPAELGVVTERAISGNEYKITIKYPDKTYGFTTDKSFMQYIRDNTDHINAVDTHSISRFSQCGKKVGDLNMPTSGTETVTVPNIKLPVVTEVEYGQPVVASNGDVYTWKKTEFKYSILKWTWVDDPNTPSGPDAPMGLTAMPSTTGIYLTWTASPQDPGCVTGYEIARSTTSGGTLSTIGTVNAGVVKYNDATAEAGTTYYYKVRAKSGSDYSPYTSEVSGKR